MQTQILMPSLTADTRHARLARWLVAEGQEISPGDIIAEIETANATMEVEAVDAGTVGAILIPAGDGEIAVGTPIAVISVKSSEPQKADGGAAQPQPGREPVPAVAVDAPAATAEKIAPAAPAAQTTLTLRQALRDAIAEEMRLDDTVFVMGEDIGQSEGGMSRVTTGLIEEFGARRVIDTPVTEAGYAGLAVGAAMAGLRPVVEFMSWSFALQAADQIVNSAAKARYRSGGRLTVPIVFRGPDGASAQSGAQNAQSVAAMFAHVPGLKIVAPATAADAKGLMKSAIRDPDPVLVLETESLYGRSGPVPDGEHLIPIGRAAIVREGATATVVTYARGLMLARKAADKLAKDGIDCEIIDLRTLRPIDFATIFASIQKTNRVVVLEEVNPVCSIGSEICARIAMDCFDHLDAPPVKVSSADVPMPFAANLERLTLPDANAVAAAVRKVCYL